MNLLKSWRRLYPSQIELEEKYTNDCKSILDVGCGEDSFIRKFKKKHYSVGVDIHRPAIENSKRLKIHDKYYVMDIMDLDKKFKPKSFDCIICNEVIEHLSKEDGYKLIQMMEKIADKRVIITTPNGFLPQNIYDGNKWHIHKSGWEVKELRTMGYKVIGTSGLRFCKGEKGDIRLKHKYFFTVLSVLFEPIVLRFPKKSFDLLCIKEMSYG